MINRKHIVAITNTGVWFSNVDNIPSWKASNPAAFIATVGQKATVLNKRLMSYNTTGEIIGFDQTSTGRFVVMIKWDKDAAPIRVGIESIMPNPPAKFWMVIPVREGQRTQSEYRDNNARRNGTSPAVARFETRARAEEYIARERAATRFHDYVVLESIQYHSGDIVVPM